MANIDQFVKVGFSISKATSLAIFFSNYGYLCTATIDDFVDGYILPPSNIILLATVEDLQKVFKTDTQYYKDIETLLLQKGNLRPNRAGINNVVVYVGVLGSGETYGNLVNEMISVNGNYARLTIDSRNLEDIFEAAKAAHSKDRRFVAQTSDESLFDTTITDNVIKELNALNCDLIDVDFHFNDSQALACGESSIATQELMGSVGDLYSQITNVTPQEYTTTQESILKDLYLSYYTTVTFTDGGALDNYAQKLLLGGFTVTGEDRKRRDIRYYFDKMFKARSLDFLAKKLAYSDASANVLNEMLTRILIEGQKNNLIVPNTIDEETGEVIKGFDIKPIYPSQLRKTNPTAYGAKRYQEVGYYRDAVTGREVAIDFYIDPEDYELAEIGF